jgi:hypothetical protein
MTVATAETHRSNILRKLKLHSIAELVLYAVRNEIVHVQSPTVLRFAKPTTGTRPLAAVYAKLPDTRNVPEDVVRREAN